MLNAKDLDQLKKILENLNIELTSEYSLEEAGVAIMRFCLAKTLREAQLLN